MSDTTTENPDTDSSTTANPPHTLTGARATLWAALTNHPGTNSATLATAAGIGRSTAGKALADFERKGLAVREQGSPGPTGTTPDTWSPHPDYSAPAPQGDNTRPQPETNKQLTTEAGEEADDTSEAPATDTAEPTTDTEPADDNPGSPGPARRDDDNASPTPVQEPADENTPTPAPTPRSTTGTGRLRPGALREMVIEFLQTHPGDSFTATGISRVIERSSGAIANSLVTLTKQGIAAQVSETPRRYQYVATHQAALTTEES